jgi:hypothetical protein
VNGIETGGRGDAPPQPEASDRPDFPDFNDQIALDESNRRNRDSASPPDVSGGGGGGAVSWIKKSADPPDLGNSEGSERARKVAEYWESKLGLVLKG